MASLTSKILFHQRTSWSWWLDHPWDQNDQTWSFFVEWIIKNSFFYWYLIPLLSEAVEASWCYFFENWLIKLKCPDLLNAVGTMIQDNYQSFYLSESFTLACFNMRHPVVEIRCCRTWRNTLHQFFGLFSFGLLLDTMKKSCLKEWNFVSFQKMLNPFIKNKGTPNLLNSSDNIDGT